MLRSRFGNIWVFAWFVGCACLLPLAGCGDSSSQATPLAGKAVEVAGQKVRLDDQQNLVVDVTMKNTSEHPVEVFPAASLVFDDDSNRGMQAMESDLAKKDDFMYLLEPGKTGNISFTTDKFDARGRKAKRIDIDATVAGGAEVVTVEFKQQ